MELQLHHYNHRSDIVKRWRDEIILDIIENNQDLYLLTWYDKNWDKQDYMCADIVTNTNGELVAISASELSDDGTRLKVICRLYVIKKHRRHHSINQKLIIPRYAEIAKTMGIDKLWITAHTFNNKIKVSVNTAEKKRSTTPRKDMPYYDLMEYEGKQIFKGVEQHSFVIDLKKVETKE
jgi:hypothetical protein